MEGRDRFPVDNIPQVWLNVYDKLDPKDKVAFSGASSVWHDWVEPKRNENLISEVASYLIDPAYSRRGFHARELCQSWKEGIDQENQTHGSNTSLWFEISADEGSRRSQLCGNTFHYAEDVQQFMKDMRTHPGNPFPGRSLACNFDFSYEREDFNEEWRDYWRSIILLLEKFGSHVHFATISFDDYAQLELGDTEGQAYLRECLLRLPNLKQLFISHECISPFLDLEDEIREFYRVNPLPRLEHLETVELSDTSLATVEEVLSSCCVPANIKRVSVYRQEHPQHLVHFDAVYGFENLQVLFAPILFHHLETLASLERRPPLREVYLSFEDAPHLEDVFRLLEVFGETLIQFQSCSRMHLRNAVNGEPFSCTLPHLKKIEFVEYCGTAEILFQFKSLTHLEICTMRDTYRQFPGFKERLNDSTIWTLMPSLQWLSLGDKVYEKNVMEQQRQD